MDELPELPFEKVLSYLSLGDRLRLSAVSRSCHEKIANSRVKSLCFSRRPIGRILGKSRWASGAFAKNFICSNRFASFFDAYGRSVLSNLKHLRLCNLDLGERNRAAFARTLNLFDQLEKLDIIRTRCIWPKYTRTYIQKRMFKLTLPMFTCFHLEELSGVNKLTLVAPRLRKVKLRLCSHLNLDIVHEESVESLFAARLEHVTVKNLRNLQFLQKGDYYSSDNSTLLSDLKQLKAIHVDNYRNMRNLFDQKRQYGCTELKIYYYGLLLDGPDDPAILSLHYNFNEETFRCLAENSSRLADQIPFCSNLDYFVIETVAPGLEVDVLKRFTYLNEINVTRPIRDIQRFLDVLKNFENIVELEFRCDQPQDLFDRLPEHGVVQKLIIHHEPSDLGFLFRLKHLIDLEVRWEIDSETARKAFEELQFLLKFTSLSRRQITIKTCHTKHFNVSVDLKKKTVSDLNAAIEFIDGRLKKTGILKKKPRRPQKRSQELE